MSQEAVALLGSNVVKTLFHKQYEERKKAALEIEQIVRSYQTQPNGRDRTRLLIDVLNREFLMNPSSQNRKGGLLGLASVSIGLEVGS